MQDLNLQSNYIAVYSIHRRQQRLCLLLPFAKVLTAHIRPTGIASMDNSSTYYLCDSSVDRISHFFFKVDSDVFDVAVSTNQIMKLLPAFKEGCKTLCWNEWGATATRWFHRDTGPFHCRVHGSWMYFDDHITELIEKNKIFSNPYPDATDAFCDFNPRIIRRYPSVSIPTQIPDQDDALSTVIQAEITTEGRDPVIASNLIAQRVVTEEWVLRSLAFTQEVRSCLPFRMFIRKKVADNVWDNVMGADPIAIFSVSILIRPSYRSVSH